nr:hypothetical protein [uncultured Pseudoalteromonas sp.]
MPLVLDAASLAEWPLGEVQNRLPQAAVGIDSINRYIELQADFGAIHHQSDHLVEGLFRSSLMDAELLTELAELALYVVPLLLSMVHNASSKLNSQEVDVVNATMLGQRFLSHL